MQCAESLRVQAYFDGEIDSVSAAEIERHAARCSECSRQLEELSRIRTALRETLAQEGAPPELRTRIARALKQEARSLKIENAQSPGTPQTPTASAAGPQAEGWRRHGRPGRSQPFWLGLLSGVGGSAVAAALAVMLWLPAASKPFLDDLVAAHVRSLMPSHLIDVASSDRHTVKPWFSGHTDVSPAVVDFPAQDFHLFGGRADYLDHQRVAVVVYKHGAHIVNVFAWAAGTQGLPGNTTRDGYHLLFWKVGDVAYCAVSDTGWDELSELARLLQSTAAPTP